jgi:hypothetical protein
MAQENPISHYGSIAGSVMAIFALVGFLGKPHMIDFIDNEIEAYDERKKEEDAGKVKLRRLLGHKMGVEDDEVHIELGKTYKKVMAEKDLSRLVDSLTKEVELNYYEIGQNIKDIKALKKVVIELETKKQDR